MFRKTLLILAIAALTTLAPAAFAQGDGCTFTEIDYPGGVATTGEGVNNQGLIVGTYLNPNNSNQSGFLNLGTHWGTLNFPHAMSTEVNGVSPNGRLIVGTYVDSKTFQPHAFLYQAGTFTSIDYPGAAQTYGEGVNDNGVIVGEFNNSSQQAGWVLSNGKFSAINWPGFTIRQARSINDSGVIVGTYADASGFNHAYMLVRSSSGNTFTDVSYPGSTNSSGMWINTGGEILGGFDVGGPNRGYVLKNGVFTAFDYPGGVMDTIPFSLNDNGEMTGGFVSSAGQNHGFKATGCQ